MLNLLLWVIADHYMHRDPLRSGMIGANSFGGVGDVTDQPKEKGQSIGGSLFGFVVTCPAPSQRHPPSAIKPRCNGKRDYGLALSGYSI